MDISLALQQILFYVFAAFVVVSALMVIIAHNPVHSALFLVAAFVGSAGLWILLQAEFLGLILVLVYVGAVMTLFLFVVMMLKLDFQALKKGFVRFLPFAIFVALVLLWLMIQALGPGEFSLDQFSKPVAHAADYSNMSELGSVLYTQYLYPFELAAVILLVALIAAIGLTFRGPRARKRQIPEEQMLVSRAERLRIVEVAPASKPGEDSHDTDL